ncbi:hypothetical protein EVAR_20994_1 [Eumeta japonica]|uniref:Uncharacterized protein n=1 Tax=Eumeta variegata TaxID=151549 RepID=A0A4C1V4Y3_EUMVA|nr:hypothetical protein EVAR_20994_1 [Eumeta japonica]
MEKFTKKLHKDSKSARNGNPGHVIFTLWHMLVKRREATSIAIGTRKDIEVFLNDLAKNRLSSSTALSPHYSRLGLRWLQGLFPESEMKSLRKDVRLEDPCYSYTTNIIHPTESNPNHLKLPTQMRKLRYDVVDICTGIRRRKKSAAICAPARL